MVLAAGAHVAHGLDDDAELFCDVGVSDEVKLGAFAGSWSPAVSFGAWLAAGDFEALGDEVVGFVLIEQGYAHAGWGLHGVRESVDAFRAAAIGAGGRIKDAELFCDVVVSDESCQGILFGGHFGAPRFCWGAVPSNPRRLPQVRTAWVTICDSVIRSP